MFLVFLNSRIEKYTAQAGDVFSKNLPPYGKFNELAGEKVAGMVSRQPGTAVTAGKVRTDACTPAGSILMSTLLNKQRCLASRIKQDANVWSLESPWCYIRPPP